MLTGRTGRPEPRIAHKAASLENAHQSQGSELRDLAILRLDIASDRCHSIVPGKVKRNRDALFTDPGISRPFIGVPFEVERPCNQVQMIFDGN